MTDTLAVGSITQLTETGTLTRFAPLTRDEVDMAQFAKPDPRDARIAELEAALREVYRLAFFDTDWSDNELLNDAGRVAGIVLHVIPAPERDMQITQEELDA